MKVLLDLNYTLVENSEVKSSPFTNQIQREVYRQWLVDMLKPFYVILITARPIVHREQTLESIRQKTNWSPNEAWFNHTRSPPPVAKRIILQDYIFPQHDVADLVGLESNPLTRAMYRGLGIQSWPVPKTGSLTTLPFIQ